MESADAQLRKAIDELTALPIDATREEREAAFAKVETAKKAMFSAGDAMKATAASRMPPTGFPGMGGAGPSMMVPPREITMPPIMTGDIVCCPVCFETDKNNNVTTPLSRKTRRESPKSHGFPVHDTAYCVKCNERMVYMPAAIREKQRTLKHEKEVRREP